MSSNETHFTVVRQEASPSVTIFDTESSLDMACDAICGEDTRRGLSPSEICTKFILVRSHPNTDEAQSSWLIIHLSHAQYDGLSLASMLQTLADVYDGKAQHLRLSSPDLSFPPYLAHLVSQRPRSRSHWTNQMAGSRNTPVFSALSNHLDSGYSSKSETFHKIEAEETVTLPQQKFDHSLQSTLISSAWAILLSHITSNNDVVFGHLVAGRDIPLPGKAAHDVVGPCVNIIPIRLQVPSINKITASEIHEIPQLIHDQLLSIGRTGFMMGWEDIIQSCTDWNENPIGGRQTLESFVQHQNVNKNPEISFAGMKAKLGWYDNPNALATVPLGVVSHPAAGGLRVRVLGSSRFLTEELAKSLVSRLCQIVKILVGGGYDETGCLLQDALNISLGPRSGT